MSFYGQNQNGGQGSGQQQQMGRQQTNPGLQNVQQVLTPQLFNLNVNPNQLHNFFNEHNTNQNQLQLNAAANASSILLQQQPQSFPVNLINEQLGVGVGQLLSSATVSQNQMQLPISMPSALNFSQALQVHAQTPPPQGQTQAQQSKQKVFTGTVTKTHDNFGFIDEEVFFQMGVVKGPILPKEGDRVLVEADFNASMPFKWNATRVQIVNMGGGLNSSLNNMSNMGNSQSQHMGFNTGVGMQKQGSAPSQPVLGQQQNPRLHGAQPVTIVSNPHSVYSAASGNRGVRPPNAGAVVPPGTPMGTPQQRDPKRPMGMPLVPEPPPFGNPSSGIMGNDREHSLRDMDRCRERERSRERARERSRERSRERMRERSRERIRQRSRERERSRERTRDSREVEKIPRARSRSRDRVPIRDRNSRERSPNRKVVPASRERSRDRSTREKERTPERSRTTRVRSRSPDRSRDRDRTTRPEDKKGKQSSEKSKDAENSKDRKESTSRNGKDRGQRSPPSSDKAKEEAKVDKSKEKEKKTVEKSKSAHSVSSDRSKRSRSKESVRTDKGHSITDRSRSRSTSPKRKSQRPPPRYAVELPKFALNCKDINVKELQRRYPNLYVPSDFFLAKSSWMETFPLDSPFELGQPCPVQIMRKGVHKIEIADPESLENKFRDIPDVLEPADASHIFKAKVMIPSISSLETIYRKSCGLNEGGTEVGENTQHIDRLISFIVGMKTSRHEVMALGGPWSPSLDGSNPQSDSQTLINTAIRCVRALTGVNLSKCKHWYRFMELYYKRTNCLETVVYYLPDVWSCLPGTKEWSTLKSMYKFALHGEKAEAGVKKEETTSENANVASLDKGAEPTTDSKKGKDDGIPKSSQSEGISKGDANKAGDGNTTEGLADVNKYAGAEDDDPMNCSGLLVIDEVGSPSKEDGDEQTKTSDLSSGLMDISQENGVNPLEEIEEHHTDGDDLMTGQDNVAVVEGELPKSLAETENDGEAEIQEVVEPRVNPKIMNVAQLREELSRRHLSPKGLKAVLVSRLSKALKDEDESKELEQAQKEDETVADQVQAELPKEAISLQESTSNLTDVSLEEIKTDEPCIRLVNPSLIMEDQDDEMSEDGEVKDDLENPSEFDFVSKFPPETFPVVKPGMKEEEIKMWERRYTLPKNSRVLVFPSESAKGGNFDCISMTLALLRDYRIIDKKEDNFEVSLFSEFFHEMLQRDFAFRIYKEIVSAAARDDVGSQQDNKDLKVEAEVDEPSAKKRKMSNPTSNSVQGKKITDPHLLLSFIFFDVTHCGYITESDVEDLCGCLGMGLTRSQIRKVVQKVVHKGNLYYRKWTDRTEKLKSGFSNDELKALAQGNDAYFPVFVFQDKAAICPAVEGGDESKAEAVIAQVDGKSVDVKKLMEQLQQYERNLAVSEANLNAMKNSLNESKSLASELKKSNESFKEELSKTKEALKKAESGEKIAKENVETFKRATERFCDRVKDLVKFPNNPSSAASTKEKTDVPSKDAKDTASN